jgi:hypothetical protein
MWEKLQNKQISYKIPGYQINQKVYLQACCFANMKEVKEHYTTSTYQHVNKE